MKIVNFVVLLTVLSLSTLVQAKVFRNAYIAFEMPDDWNCTLEQTEWVCRSAKLPDMKEAIIILTAKEVGPTDSFPMYESHLNNPITANAQPAATQSKMIYKAKYVQINNQQWLDGLHLGSEVPNYFTRYMATIKNKIAVLVTFSAHEKFYSKYSTMFHNAIMSMRVIASQNIGSRPDMGPLRPGSETIGQTINSAMPADMYSGKEESKGGNGTLFLGLLLMIVAGAGYYFYSKKK
jgi:hypothetical protein